MWEVYIALGIAIFMLSVGYAVKDLFFRRLALLYAVAFLLLSAGYYASYVVNLRIYFSFMNVFSYLIFSYTFFLSYKLVKTQRKEMEKKYLDTITGVFNRLYFEEVLPQRIKAILSLGLNYLVAFLDLDNLKQVNDTYGHLKGDELIKNLAKVIKQSIRSHEDVVIRYGGDEFLVVAPIRACGDSLILLERIERNIEEMNRSLEIPISLSIGFACYPDDEKDFEKLLEIADKRMYQVKLSRKGLIST
ncbi:MAG: GGDEF domain-containing protein [Aquificota bacterium]|jgi:diguanylate cyclase (GGDEF)-like protein|nr:GGDEF domain-containing protein [Aquificaceae bacterium]QWK12912.1 MAG: GGDEF domain-containing protein [Aquificota bacterium]